MMIKSKEKVTLFKELPSEVEENVTILVRINQENFLTRLMYKSPKTDNLCFIEQFENFLDPYSVENYRVIKCGDFNIDILETNYLSLNYIDPLEGN